MKPNRALRKKGRLAMATVGGKRSAFRQEPRFQQGRETWV
jgi:hypothetical protein